MTDPKTKPADRQTRRKARTRRLLVEATTDLLLEKSVDALTVQDITERADVARGTFYVYFDTKEDAVWSLLEAFLEEIDQYLINNPATEDDARLVKWQYIFRQIAENRNLLIALLGQNGHISTLRRMESYIAQLMERDLDAGYLVPRDAISSRFAAQYLAGALTRLIIHWLEQFQDMSVDEFAEQFFTMARRQFENDEAREV